MDILLIILLSLFVWKMRFQKEMNNEYLSFETSQAWKGLFSLVIVFHHLSQRSSGGMAFHCLKYVGFLIVAVFFFFSGYGLQKKYITDSNYKNNYLRKRIPSVLLPYILMNAVYWGAYAICGNLYSIKEIFDMVLKGRPIVSFSWYVINIVFFYLIFYLLMIISRNNYNRMIVGAGLSYALWICICVLLSFGIWWYCSSQLFVLGILWAAYEPTIIKFIKAHYSLTACVVTISFFTCFFLSYITSITVISLIMKMLSAVLFTIAILLFSLKVKIGNSILGFLGKISFEIYLSHGLFILLFRNHLLNIQNDLVWSLLVLFSTVIFSFAFHKLYRFIPMYFNKSKELQMPRESQ